MSRPYVALLYSIVLGPGRRVVMADLRALAEDLGFRRPRTLLASGNLLFEAEAEADGGEREIEARLEPAFADRFGRAIDIIVRAGADWPRLMAGNPFPEAAAREPARVAVRVMRAPADAAAVERLTPRLGPGERLAVVGGDLWVHVPQGFAPSRLPGAITPRREGVGTFRNWNTVRRIG
ncbi:MAG TPA: DUF1697 domain-containing protein, partial [Amaricoccus sp.]|nr:DUF1697 domain-containing protein [Amaricoccus sp.]